MNNIYSTSKRLYFNQETAFTSIRNAYLDVKQIMPGIKYNQVKDWCLTNVERETRDVRGYNSYVAPHAYHEYQVDVGFITDKQLPLSER